MRLTPAMYDVLDLICRGRPWAGARTFAALKRRRLVRSTSRGIELTGAGAKHLAKHLNRLQEKTI
jgi:uncharacterized membrane-anchored protein